MEQTIDGESKSCACCGGDLYVIGEDIAKRLDVVPTTFRVMVTRRPRYGCRVCEATPVQASASPHIVEAGLPTEALIANVLVAKVCRSPAALPAGADLCPRGRSPRSLALSNWVRRAAWWLTPLRVHLLAELERSPKLLADETTALVLDPGRGRTKTEQLWAYARVDRPLCDTPSMRHMTFTGQVDACCSMQANITVADPVVAHLAARESADANPLDLSVAQKSPHDKAGSLGEMLITSVQPQRMADRRTVELN